MRAILDIPGKVQRILLRGEFGDAHNGFAFVKTKTGTVAVMFSNGDLWDHVSVSRKDRCPTWEEMCEVKDIFFDPEDCVIQYHPPASRYVSVHPYCLHMWLPQGVDLPMPPLYMIA